MLRHPPFREQLPAGSGALRLTGVRQGGAKLHLPLPYQNFFPFPAVERCPTVQKDPDRLRLSVLGTRGENSAGPTGFWRSPRTVDPSALPRVCSLHKSKLQVKKNRVQKSKANSKKIPRKYAERGKVLSRRGFARKKGEKKAPQESAGPLWREGREGESGSRKGRNLLKGRPFFSFLKGRKSARTTSPARARGSKGRRKTLAAPWPHRKSWRSSDFSVSLRARKRHGTSGTPPRPLAFSFPQKNHLEVTSLHAQTTRPTIQRSQSP